MEGEEWGVVANDTYRSGQVNETPVTETKQDEQVDENNNESADDWAEEEEESGEVGSSKRRLKRVVRGQRKVAKVFVKESSEGESSEEEESSLGESGSEGSSDEQSLDEIEAAWAAAEDFDL